jgi:hypothetical protein
MALEFKQKRGATTRRCQVLRHAGGGGHRTREGRGGQGMADAAHGEALARGACVDQAG